MPHDAPGHRALEHIDEALRDRPHKNGDALSHATMCLAAFRDRLVAARRGPGIGAAQRKQLAHVNAVITIVLGTHFPLGEIPWDELEKARAWLAEAVAMDEPVA
jgi:glutathione S-transferase